jgi:hypothetical protein
MYPCTIQVMVQESDLNYQFGNIKIAVIIAIIIGIILSVFFMLVETNSNSSLYIVPNSIIHNHDDNTVLFNYGVKSSESGKMDYTIDTFINDNLIKTKRFSLNKGEILDEQDKIILPSDIQFPSKISLRLTTKTATEEVHFWVK